ncbi:MAG: chitobiase/beta-hexosaminidase C-terminal domain-containing protein [Bacteroidales bacterium]|nr:chitobiase/beta-hexosaminidase C-terminal domain-containing protein [Bacteroidales bacterium]
MKQGEVHKCGSGGEYYVVDLLPGNGGGMSKVAYVRDGNGKRFFMKELIEQRYDVNNPTSVAYTRRRIAVYTAVNKHTLPGASCSYTHRFFNEGRQLFVVTDLWSGFTLDTGSLFHKVDLAGRVQLAKALAYALKPFEAEDLVFADLKPENVLLHPKGDHLTLKLIDLDSAFPASDPPEPGSVVGTPPYYSPELFNYNCRFDKVRPPRLTPKSDIFALGLIIFELLFGQKYAAHLLPEVPCELCIHDKMPSIPFDIPESLRKLLASMLSYRPDSRPSLDEVINTLGSAKLVVRPLREQPEPEVIIDRYPDHAIVSLFNYTPLARLHYRLGEGRARPYTEPFMIDDDGIVLEVLYGSKMSIHELNVSPVVKGKVSLPTVKVESGRRGWKVTLECSTPNASIFYTTDGTVPTRKNGFRYTGPFIVPTGSRVLARGMMWGKLQSDVASRSLTY